MLNVFLVFRTVFFALLTYFHVLLVVFASWNIVAARSSGTSAPGASVFLLINSILIFALVLMAYLAEVVCPKARPAQVRIECGWTALMGVLQLAASVDVTINGPPTYCQTQSPWGMCASSSLLVQISWLATLIIFTYCLAICVSAATHTASFPDIWVTPVPHVPWFNPVVEAPAPVVISHLPTHNHSKMSSISESETSCAVTKYISEQWEKFSRTERDPVPSGPILFTPGRQSADSARPTWARQHRIHRGIDDPFSKPLPKPKESSEVLAPPPKTYAKPAVGSRDAHTVERGRRPETTRTSSSSTLASQTPYVFPRRVANPDLPIPRPNLSQWIRADAVSLRTKRSTS